MSVYTINKGLFDVLNVAQQTVLYDLTNVFLHELGRWFSEVLDFMLSLGRASILRRMDLSCCLFASPRQQRTYKVIKGHNPL